MQERTLFRLSLAIMLLGFLALLFLAETASEPTEAAWDSSSQGEQMRLQGIVQKATPVKKAFFLTIAGQREETMDVVFFPKEDVFLKEGDIVEVTGTTTTYQGEKEVVANKVTIIASSPETNTTQS